MVTAIYPGTFDPITKGHFDIVTRASKLFDHIILAVAESPGKKPMFDIYERVALAKEILADFTNIEVISFNGLIMDLAQEKKANVIVRGLRAVSDVDFELQMAVMNRHLIPNVETVFITPNENLSYISSSLVREIAALRGDVSAFVHEPVVTAIKRRYS